MDAQTAIAKAEEARKQITVFGSLNVQVFIVHAIKAPMLFWFNHSRIVKLIDRKLQEPTMENTWHPNTHRLIAIRKEFFGHCTLTPPRLYFLRVISKFIVIMHDYDSPYTWMFRWCVQRLFEIGWDFDVDKAKMEESKLWNKVWRI